VKTYRVKDLMVLLSEYATVPVGLTLFKAMLALERAQEEEFAFSKRMNRKRSIVYRSQL
jgi:hypothetical protein